MNEAITLRALKRIDEILKEQSTSISLPAIGGVVSLFLKAREVTHDNDYIDPGLSHQQHEALRKAMIQVREDL